MDDPIVIPTSKSVQKTLQKNALKAEQISATKVPAITENGSGGLGSSNAGQPSRLQSEVREKLAFWQSNRKKQSTLLKSLEVGYSMPNFLTYIVHTKRICTMNSCRCRQGIMFITRYDADKRCLRQRYHA